MNLQDKLAEALCDRLESHPNHAPGTPCRERAKKIMALTARAQQSERAATIEECKRAAQKAPTFSNDLIGRGKSYAVKCIDELPRNCLVLDEILTQARREQREKDCTAVDAGYAKWEKDSLCHESGCGCVTEYIKLAIRAELPQP